MKKILKVMAISFAILFGLFVLYCLVALAVWRNAATGQDAEASVAIRKEFILATKTNLLRQIEIEVNPLRNKTIVYIESAVSEEEKKKISLMADQISLANSNRPISIVYEIKRTNDYNGQ